MKLTVLLSLCCLTAFSQSPYPDLPVGKHPVGFRVVTITDASRETIPELNYLGEKNMGDRRRKITIHLWYPAKAGTGKGPLTVSDYSTQADLKETNEAVSAETRSAREADLRATMERFFGKVSDEAFTQLLATRLAARADATPTDSPTPLIVGTLRPFSTTTTNELLASNGFTVAMIWNANFDSFTRAALDLVPDLQQAIGWALQNLKIDNSKIGTYGFSGAGFMPVLLGMFDTRVKAMADMESAIFGIDYRDSDYYKPNKLRIPFMHIYNKELALRDTHFSEFYKMKYSKRYHVILNQPNWHHWNVATEGYLSCTVLKNRGVEQENIRMSFVIANMYLLNFFNSVLNGDSKATEFLTKRPTLPSVAATTWDINVLEPVKYGPTLADFENIIRTRGIGPALEIVQPTLSTDSTSGIWTGFAMNRLGYRFKEEKKLDEAIGVFKLNSELHPADPNWMDSLAEAYEIKGDSTNMKKHSQMILDLLSKKEKLSDFESSLKANSERRLK